MSLNVITTNDLKKFKEEVLIEIRAILEKNPAIPYKRWLKSNEVRKLLKVSSGTLQTLRRNKTLKFTKLGGIIYYDQDYVHQLFLNNLQTPQAE